MADGMAVPNPPQEAGGSVFGRDKEILDIRLRSQPKVQGEWNPDYLDRCDFVLGPIGRT